MNSVIYAWIASITFGLYSVVAKLIGKYQLKNSYQFSFFNTLFGGMLMALIAYANGGRFATQWTFIVLAAVFLALGNTLYLMTLKALDVSVMGPLYNFRSVITVVLGVLLLQEAASIQAIFFISVIIITGFFATMDERFSLKSFFSKSIFVGLVYMIVSSIQSILINRAVDQTDYWTAVLWMGLLAIVFSFIFLFQKFKKDLAQSNIKDYRGVGLLAVIGALGDLAAYKAYAGNVGISSVIISLPISMVLAFVLSVWKPTLMEKHPLKVYLVRFSATAVMIWAALQLR